MSFLYKSLILIFTTFLMSVSLYAQNDTEFWFVVPELSYRQNLLGGTPGTLRIATQELESTVTISMPANRQSAANPNGFPDIVRVIPANSNDAVVLTDYIDTHLNPFPDPFVENRVLTGSGINNVGLHITATNVVNIYYEVNNEEGSDLWTLKGRNGIGRIFFTPFMDFETWNEIPAAYSAIDIVATKPNTQVIVTPPVGRDAHFGTALNSIPGGVSRTIIIPEAGQTLSIFPANYSVLPGDQLGGTKIVASEDIAVTVNTDAIRLGPQTTDLIGDQITPIDILGYDYIIPETKGNAMATVVATQDGTVINALKLDQTHLPGSPYTLNEGEKAEIDLGTGLKYARITSTDPDKTFYLFHVSAENASLGGAQVPGIGCTGNTQLSFTRARDDKFYFYVVCERGNEYNFLIDGEDPNLTYMKGANFEPIPGDGDWMAYITSSIPASKLKVGQHLVENTGGVFHLAIINGFPGQGYQYYGYYSDFGGLNVGATVAGQTEQIRANLCHGDSLQLFAYGGTTYDWVPDAYLDDPTSNKPVLRNLPADSAFKYIVNIGGACGSGTIEFTIQVAEEITAHLKPDVTNGCSPLTVNYTDESINPYFWQVMTEDTVTYDLDPNTPQGTPPGYPAPYTFTRTYRNTGTEPEQHTVKLLTKNSSYCSDIYSRSIVVFPEIKAKMNPDRVEGCHPLLVNFGNLSTGNTDKWFWKFGDGGTSIDPTPSHTYFNLTGPDSTLTAELVAVSPYLCRDTVDTTINVHPYIEAMFAFDTVVACSPHQITITDQSIGADLYTWDFDGSTSNNPGPIVTKDYENLTATPKQYTVSLHVENLEGCTSDLSQQLTINPEVKSIFTPDKTVICSPDNVKFTNTSTNATSFFWDFGDGGTSLESDPSHTFERNLTGADIVYTVILKATSPYFCENIDSVHITVHPYIEAAYTVDDIVGCSPFDVIVHNESYGVTKKYTWDYGDGFISNSSGAILPPHQYINNDSLTRHDTLMLIAESNEGCFDTTFRVITTHPLITADFTSTEPDNEGCHELEVTFDDLSVNVDPSNYLWDFGDGGSSTEVEPSHTFTNFGTSDTSYYVTLTTQTSDGECVKSKTTRYTVFPNLDVEFTFEQAQGCPPFDVNFKNLSIGGETYVWTFGDGASTTRFTTDTVWHQYNNSLFDQAVEYEVSLYGEFDRGASGKCSEIKYDTIVVYPQVDVDFSADISSGCQPLTVAFTNNTLGGQTHLWEYGDGSTSNTGDVNSTHTFYNSGSSDTTYQVVLNSYSIGNTCMDSDTINITVYPYIDASFTIPDYLGCTPFDVTLNNTSVNATNYSWDFGDGSPAYLTGSDVSFTHEYTNDSYSDRKDYTITLTATHGLGDGCPVSASRKVTVEPDILAVAAADNLVGCHPHTVKFTNTSQGAAYYLWDFGNGTTSQLAEPSQRFENIGTKDTVYHVMLYTIASNNECMDTISFDVTVRPYLNADFTFTNSVSCHPSTIEFVNTSIGGNIYTWSFGDGSPDDITDVQSNVSHEFTNTSYSDIASYDVTLLVESDGGSCSSSRTKTVQVYPNIRAGFSALSYEGCHPFQVELSNETLGGNYIYKWDFDDGTTSDENTPVHTFNNHTGDVVTREVELIATSEYNCSDTVTADITIQPKPVARFETDVLIDCPPYDMSLTNTTLYADNYEWDFGDGSPKETAFSVIHEYDNDLPDIAEYNLGLIATTNYGCIDSITQLVYAYPKTEADFTMNDAGCSPLTVSFTNASVRGNMYLWDFGDGSNLAVTNPINIYHNLTGYDTIYEVQLTSISNYGCVDSKSDTVYVYAQPDAEFTATPTHQNYPNATVRYTNLTGVGNWNYIWTLGDGANSILKDPDDHTYSTWGNYDIVLNVSSDHCSDEISHMIRIFPAPPEAAVDSVFPGCEPLDVQFINNSIYGSDYLWDFDDGTTSSDFEPFHTFETAGLYNVKMTVTGSGGIDYFYRTIEVYKMPELDFKVVPDEILLPNQAARFFNLTEHADYYLWDYGDGNQSSEESPEYLYSEVGQYVVSLEAWTYDGCYDILTKEAAVNVKGEGELVYPTAFKPDMTGSNGGHYDQMSPERNNIFHPAFEGVREYKLVIYNRWGQKLFESNDINIGWDGYFRDQLCEQGVYVWQVTGTYQNGEPFRMVGDVTLLHHDNTN